MRIRRGIGPILVTFLVGAAPARAQLQPAPVYELPPDGTWVEYAWTADDGKGQKTTGTFRISSVGRVQLKGKAQRWLEIRKEQKQEGQTTVQVRKLLIDERALARGPFAAAVSAVFHRSGPDGPVIRLSAARAQDFLALGLHGGVPLKTVAGRERLETKLGTFITRHLAARGESEGRTLEYHVWLTSEVPFGWAKVEVKEIRPKDGPRTIFTGTAEKTGKGAKSEVEESRVK
jgi:hypothetical protein